MRGKGIVELSGHSESGRGVAGKVICVRQRYHTEKGGVRGTVMIILNICQTFDNASHCPRCRWDS